MPSETKSLTYISSSSVMLYKTNPNWGRQNDVMAAHISVRLKQMVVSSACDNKINGISLGTTHCMKYEV
jgi:hypothetical protein